MRVRERDKGGVRCPYCRDGIGSEVAPCAGCGVRLHPACAAEAGRCPTIGCTTWEPPRTGRLDLPFGEAPRRGRGLLGGAWTLLPVAVAIAAFVGVLATSPNLVKAVLPFLYLVAASLLGGVQLVRVLRQRRFVGARLRLRPHPGREGQPLELTLTLPSALRALAREDDSLVLRAELRHVRRSLPRGVGAEQARGEQAIGHVDWRTVALIAARHLRDEAVTFTFVTPVLRRGWEYGWELGTTCEVPGPDFVETWDVPFAETDRP